MTMECERIALERAKEMQLFRLGLMGDWVSNELLEQQFGYGPRSLQEHGVVPCCKPPNMDLVPMTSGLVL